MVTAIDSLWPAEIEVPDEETAPIAILKQQASILGQKTNNLVEAIVQTKAADFSRFMDHSFILVAPALNFYRYPLFSVQHRADKLYPVTIVKQSSFEGAGVTSKKIEAEDEDQFKGVLKNIFADAKTKKVVGALIKQSTASDEIAPP